MDLKAGDKVIFKSISKGILIRKKEVSNYNRILDEVIGMGKIIELSTFSYLPSKKS